MQGIVDKLVAIGFDRDLDPAAASAVAGALGKLSKAVRAAAAPWTCWKRGT